MNNNKMCEKCRGSTLLGINYEILESENSEIEQINLIKCNDIFCKNGYKNLPIDDSNYDSDNISK